MRSKQFIQSLAKWPYLMTKYNNMTETHTEDKKNTQIYQGNSIVLQVSPIFLIY